MLGTRLTLLLIAILAINLFPLSAWIPPAVAQGEQRTFVGRVAGTEAFVGIVTDGNWLIAYLCDGPHHELGDFYSGPVGEARDGVLTLATEDSEDLLLVYIDAGSLAGVLRSGGNLDGEFLTPDRVSFSFTAEPARGPGAFYRMDETLPDGTEVEGGWVVLNTGEIRGQFHPAPDVTVTQQDANTWDAKLRRAGRLTECLYDTRTSTWTNAFTSGDLLEPDAPCPAELLSLLPSDPRTLANQMQQTPSASQNVPVQGQNGQQMTVQANHADLCLHGPAANQRPGTPGTSSQSAGCPR